MFPSFSFSFQCRAVLVGLQPSSVPFHSPSSTPPLPPHPMMHLPHSTGSTAWGKARPLSLRIPLTWPPPLPHGQLCTPFPPLRLVAPSLSLLRIGLQNSKANGQLSAPSILLPIPSSFLPSYSCISSLFPPFFFFQLVLLHAAPLTAHIMCSELSCLWI